MSTLLRQSGRLEDVIVEPLTGHDGQGKPAYGAPVTIQARVIRSDAKDVNSNIRMGSGYELRTVQTLWIDAEQVPLPVADDRLTFADGTKGIVAERFEGKRLGGQLDHVRIKTREE